MRIEYCVLLEMKKKNGDERESPREVSKGRRGWRFRPAYCGGIYTPPARDVYIYIL